MRHRAHSWIVAGLLLMSVAVAPLGAQPSSTPPIIHSLQRPQPAPFVPGQKPIVADVPTLAFDAETKRYDASPGEKVAPFTFNLTNVWTNEIVIDRVQASCGCTTASLPANPWHLPPQGSGQVHAQVNLAGKMGLITKTLTFYYRMLPGNAPATHMVNLTVNIPPPPAVAGTLSEAERAAAMAKARADSQAIFKGDCAQCHADKGRNAMGQDLYAVDCGICHESPHRESLVPDLHALKQPTDFDYWKTIITLGKPHTMMPAFAATQGGPLTDAQIDSLAAYLNHVISHNLSSAVTNTASASIFRATSLKY
jgi:mono/diheme cytochrome c family protein